MKKKIEYEKGVFDLDGEKNDLILNMGCGVWGRECLAFNGGIDKEIDKMAKFWLFY